jgi:hypothetical protein
VVGVRHDLMRTAGKPLHAALQVIKAHGEVTRVTPSRLQPHPYGKKIPYHQQTQAVKADQRRLLSKLLDGGAADGEDRDPLDAVDAVIARRVCGQDVRVEVTAADQHDVALLQDVTVS